MNRLLSRCQLLLLWSLIPLAASAQEEGEQKVHAAGLGFSFSSGQSVFFSWSSDPFQTSHMYLAAGVHIEEEGIPQTYWNPYLQRYERTSSQTYYLELGLGWRRLLFREQMAGGLFPHLVIEGGGSGYLARPGRLRNYFRETTLHWAPYLQAGAGVSIFTGEVIYRVEGGYFAVFSYLPKEEFPPYGGAFVKIHISSAQKPR